MMPCRFTGNPCKKCGVTVVREKGDSASRWRKRTLCVIHTIRHKAQYIESHKEPQHPKLQSGTYAKLCACGALCSKYSKGICRTCWSKNALSGEAHPEWKGGRSMTCGYMRVQVAPCQREYEHKLIAERALGRKLKRGELAHHINGDKTDNRNCNLLICDLAYHMYLHQRMSRLYQQMKFSPKPQENVE